MKNIDERMCMNCSGSMQNRKARQNYCGQECWDAKRAKAKKELTVARTKPCAKCKELFVVKKSQITAGHGKYCSQKCSRDAGVGAHLTTPENLKLANKRRLESIAINGTRHPRGDAHHMWKGGAKASIERALPKSSAFTKKYRKENPEKVREFTLRRKSRKFGRLPKGTVKRIGDSQRWNCIVCNCSVHNNYHVDHIQPLAKGGTHTPMNIQILCPTCNVRKGAKDPVDFMQERGFLL